MLVTVSTSFSRGLGFLLSKKRKGVNIFIQSILEIVNSGVIINLNCCMQNTKCMK